jgi:EAL domain-containing protein (putative c-di-GMP-specific phosphodiesterase class I)
VDLEIAAIAAALATGADLPPDVALSFNASPSTLCDERLVELLDATEPRPLIVEVTEHAVVDDYRQLDDAMVSLRRRGVRLAVDDAGAGFASLRHIVRLQPELIKLDPSLTQNLRDDPVRGPLADCLIEFARRTGSAIIAEGIETPADLATWRDLGAHAVQGHLLGRPGALPAPAWTGALRRPETTARTAAP